MRRRAPTENPVGGNYTWYDSRKDPPEILPLLYCIGAILQGRDINSWVQRLLPPNDPHYAAGDPGWEIRNVDDSRNLLLDANGKFVYHAWTDESMSGLHPSEGIYDEDMVKIHLHKTLVNFAEAHPDRKTEVDEVIARYTLDPNSERS